VTTIPHTALPATYTAGIRRILKDRADQWLAALPGHVDATLTRWRLTPDGPVLHGFCAIVLPVTADDGRPAVLKIGYQDPGTRTEAVALRAWDGRGAVRLLDADLMLDPAEEGGVGALLLERLDPARSLHQVEDDEAATVTGAVLAELARPLGTGADLGGVPDLAATAARWLEELPRHWESLGRPGDRRLLDAALATCRDLGPEPAGALVHIDLHQANVLAAEREPWLAIDPQAMVADPAFCLVPFLRNKWHAVAGSADPRAAFRRRFDIVVESSGVDRDRAAAWTLARAVDDLLWAVRHGDDEGVSRPVSTAIAEWISEPGRPIG
jgi:streptomycin 6-kinase